MSTTIKYKNSTIATLNNETKTLTTRGTWLEDDIEIQDVSSGEGGITPIGTKQISITSNGVTTEDVTNYASAEITVDVPNNDVYQDEDGYIVLDNKGNKTDEWHRPDEWMPYANGWNDSNFDGCYFVYDLIDNTSDLLVPQYYAIYARTYGSQYIVDGGYVDENGIFTVEETFTSNSATRTGNFLPIWDGVTPNERYYVVRVIPASGQLQNVCFSYLENSVWRTKIENGTGTGGGSATLTQPCVEIYGRLPYYTSSNYEQRFRCHSLRHVNIIDMKSLTNINSLFYQSYQLERIDGLETWDTSSVTDMSYAFNDCYLTYSTLNGIKNWDVSNVTNFSYMFQYCRTAIIDLKKWDASSATNISYMFRGCRTTEITLPKNLSGNESQSDMFSECYSLKKIDFNNSKICLKSYTFNSCQLLMLNIASSSIITSTETSKTTNMNNEFASNRQLLKINMRGKDTSAVTTMQNFAGGCFSLQSVDFTGCDLSAVTNTATNQFNQCYSLIELKGFVHYQSFSLSHSTLIPAENLVEILTNLPTVSTSKTITLGGTNKGKLTAEQIAIATEKGWTVA